MRIPYTYAHTQHIPRKPRDCKLDVPKPAIEVQMSCELQMSHELNFFVQIQIREATGQNVFKLVSEVYASHVLSMSHGITKHIQTKIVQSMIPHPRGIYM